MIGKTASQTKACSTLNLSTPFLSVHFLPFEGSFILRGFPSGSVVKNQPANAGDVGLIPGLGRSPGKGNDKPLQYSCLENPMDRGAWQAIDHGVAKELDTTKPLTNDNSDKSYLDPEWMLT